jgi:hypothetical protein
MKHSIALTALAMAFMGTAASAQDAQPSQQQQPQQNEKKICRTDRMTGSLTRRTRICMTATQWRELSIRTNKGVGEMQGQGSGGQVVQNNGSAPG